MGLDQHSKIQSFEEMAEEQEATPVENNEGEGQDETPVTEPETTKSE